MLLPHRTTLAAIALLLSAATAGAQPKDHLGDPLPAGAIARIGTTRLALDREIQAIAVAPDGKRIAAVSDSMLGVWDVPGGKQVLNLPWPHGDVVPPAVIGFTAGGKSLVVNLRAERTACVLDIASGKVERAFPQEGIQLQLAHDHRSLFQLVSDNRATAVTIERRSLANGSLQQHWVFAAEPSLADGSYWLEATLSHDDKILAIHEFNVRKRQQLLRLHDAVTGAEMRRWPVPWPLLRKRAFSADGKLLAGLGNGTVRVWDINADKEPRSWALQSGINTGRAALAFAPDGASLFLTDAAGIGRWDWRSGKRVQHYPECGGPIAFLDGGKTIAVQGPIGAIRLLDVASGKDRCPLPHAGDHAAIAPDSRYIAWSEGGAIVLADGTGHEIRRWPAHERFVGPLAFAPDGKTLASAGTDMRIRLWDIPEGRERRTLIRTGVQRLLFSPDGRRLVTSGGWDLCLWDVASGKRLRWWYGRGEAPVMAPGFDVLAIPDRSAGRLRLVEPSGDTELHTLNGYRAVLSYGADQAAPFAPLFAPDRRLLLAGADGEAGFDALAAWDVATGRRLSTVLHADRMMLNHATFSPDARRLAAMRADGRLVLLNAATGATVRLLGVVPEPLTVPPVFTPDGRTLITAHKDRVHLWEVASGGEIVRRGGHQDTVRELTISADGRLLASGSADRTTLIWDLAHLAPGSAALPEALWGDLASSDAARGRRAVEALIAVPGQAVALLQKRLPVAAPDPGQLTRWLANLGSDDFAERQEAERALDQLAELAGPALRQALAGKPPVEARRRIENLLKKLDGPTLGAAQLRAVRGVQVLEALASPEACRLLAALAKGPAGARLTSEAREAVERLTR